MQTITREDLQGRWKKGLERRRSAELDRQVAEIMGDR
jgi:hypothetical protein